MALSDSLFKHVDDTDNSRLDVININIFLEYFLQVSYEILPQAAKHVRCLLCDDYLASHLSKFQRFSSSLLKKTLSRKTISSQNSITTMNAFIPNDKQVLVSKRRKHRQCCYEGIVIAWIWTVESGGNVCHHSAGKLTTFMSRSLEVLARLMYLETFFSLFLILSVPFCS